MFCVGDLVLTEDGRKGFIEEIIIDPNTSSNKLQTTGKYSVYSIEVEKYTDGFGHFYLGDWIGNTITKTGSIMKKENLENIMNKCLDYKGVAKDFKIVINNLGRKSGKNE